MTETTTRTETQPADLALLDQQLALGAYLQALLRPPAEVAAQPVPAVAEGASAGDPAGTQAATVVPAAAPAATSLAADGVTLPAWAQGRFQCLLFKVAGLTLALPLARLNGVLHWDGAAVTEMPNHQAWFLGLREHLGRKVKLIDVANVVLPSDRYRTLAPASDGRIGKVILIGDGEWGLACDDVGEVITLSAQAVKWRTQQGGRPWLAGTVIKEMCALVDTDVFAQMLGGPGPCPGRG